MLSCIDSSQPLSSQNSQFSKALRSWISSPLDDQLLENLGPICSHRDLLYFFLQGLSNYMQKISSSDPNSLQSNSTPELSNENSLIGPIIIDNLIASIPYFQIPSSKSNLNALPLYCDAPVDIHSKTLRSKKKKLYTVLSTYKGLWQSLWISITNGPFLTPHSKVQILQLMPTKILPFMSSPVALADFFWGCYNNHIDEWSLVSPNSQSTSTSRLIPLLGLNSIFYLVLRQNLEFPDFYTKVYRILTPTLIQSPARFEYFRLVYIFLIKVNKKYLSLGTVVAFIKKMLRLAIHATPESIMFLLATCYNLLVRHNDARKFLYSSESLIHVENELNLDDIPLDRRKLALMKLDLSCSDSDSDNSDDDTEDHSDSEDGSDSEDESDDEKQNENEIKDQSDVDQNIFTEPPTQNSSLINPFKDMADAYDFWQPDFEKSHALESWFWEIKLFENHWAPHVVDLAKKFSRPFSQQLLDPEKYISTDIDSSTSFLYGALLKKSLTFYKAPLAGRIASEMARLEKLARKAEYGKPKFFVKQKKRIKPVGFKDGETIYHDENGPKDPQDLNYTNESSKTNKSQVEYEARKAKQQKKMKTLAKLTAFHDYFYTKPKPLFAFAEDAPQWPCNAELAVQVPNILIQHFDNPNPTVILPQ